MGSYLLYQSDTRVLDTPSLSSFPFLTVTGHYSQVFLWRYRILSLLQWDSQRPSSVLSLSSLYRLIIRQPEISNGSERDNRTLLKWPTRHLTMTSPRVGHRRISTTRRRLSIRLLLYHLPWPTTKSLPVLGFCRTILGEWIVRVSGIQKSFRTWWTVSEDRGLLTTLLIPCFQSSHHDRLGPDL